MYHSNTQRVKDQGFDQVFVHMYSNQSSGWDLLMCSGAVKKSKKLNPGGEIFNASSLKKKKDIELKFHSE